MLPIKKKPKNMDYDLEKLKKQMKRKLSDSRFRHTVGVSYTAAALAMRYGYNLNHAMAAGLLHDCAKNLTDEERDKYCKKYALELSEVERAYPYLIHAKLGAVLAKEKYGVEDEEILSAIRWHTTGKADMSFFEAVIFSADFMEPNRRELECMPKVRELIYRDLNAALYLILKQTLIHLEHKGQVIEEHTKEAYEYYSNLFQKGSV